MYCKECGKQIDDDSKFCSHCGTRLVTEIPKTVTFQTTNEINSYNKDKSVDTSSIKIKENQKEFSKYDKTYTKEIEATVTGSLIIILNLIILFFVPLDKLSEPINRLLFGLFITFWRIIATIWVINVARRQNRSYPIWGFFAFLIPNLALVIIGLLNKINSDYIDSLNFRDDFSKNIDSKKISDDLTIISRKSKSNFMDGDFDIIKCFFKNQEYIIYFRYHINKYYHKKNIKIKYFDTMDDCLNDLTK